MKEFIEKGIAPAGPNRMQVGKPISTILLLRRRVHNASAESHGKRISTGPLLTVALQIFTLPYFTILRKL